MSAGPTETPHSAATGPRTDREGTAVRPLSLTDNGAAGSLGGADWALLFTEALASPLRTSPGHLFMSGVGVSLPLDASADEELVRVGAGLWESHQRPEGVGPRPFFAEAASQGRRHSRAAAGRTLESSWS